MRRTSTRTALLLGTSAVLLFGPGGAPARSQDQNGEAEAFERGAVDDADEIVVTGTRREARSASESLAPVDVISGTEFVNQGSNDVQDLLRTSVPSYNVNTQPISDAATVIRPANLRALSPDNTLILVNGKRRHRGSVISFLGGGISDGAQGADISVIPALALQQVEVLRDGASSQYGSDAIAGVINFRLKEAPDGGTVEAVYGSTYDGDGDNYRFAGNIGLPLYDSGFINITAEYGETDGTVRSIVRRDVASLIAAGNTAAADFSAINSYTGEVPQYWGQPDVDDNLKIFVNTGYELNENAELYAFGNYAERTVTGGFFYRNPTNRGGVYAGPVVDPETGALAEEGVASILVGDLDGLGVGEECPAGIPLTGTDGLIPDADILAQVAASANCFSFYETIPGGFTPRFGGDNSDWSVAGGIRGAFPIGTGLSYDFSVVRGVNETRFFINNTLNASLGPDSPRDFVPGAYRQAETILDAAFSYGLDVGFASDLNVAFGAQYREEKFDISQGDQASFALGSLSDQGFSSSSNGFGGFTSSSSSKQNAYAFYTDLEADVTDALTLQGALRYEDYDSFGDTLDYKVSGLYRVTDAFRVRGTFSTGFHAPTAGQANVTNVTTQNVNGVLVDQGTIPLTSGPGQLAADFIEARDGGRPTLGTEESTNFSVGAVFDLGPTNWTIDYFNIDVNDRIALAANINFLEALNFVADQNGFDPYGTVIEGLNGLSDAGVINRSEFVGFEDLTEFRYFSNSFDTTTQGVEVVGTMPFSLTRTGASDATLSFAYIDTKVDDPGEINPIDETRVAALEELLPELKGAFTLTHVEDRWRALLRAVYFGEWEDTSNGTGGQGDELNFDAELGFFLTDKLELIAGATNVFDNYPDKNPDALSLGQLYPEGSPSGFVGGAYYFKVRYVFD
ncbi:TonB-dependent receptor plug domain-containing protein [Parvularcula dongshanensis]|uniref:Iron complex outermembrane receptor protein n=1 Tax=Parvularcula dongshanensis TaxID=1173995 RepID=A0A840I6A9_9PROT|nr:TonB-dependent receptor [Parvularcula dongshanensis]MBB4660419.1 iron complex outermembrane receptor protein [Parvularcula dongshanensis]